jgi:hypothetical protein
MPDLVYAGQRVTADMLSYRSPYSVAYARIAANSSGATAETVWVTSGAITFENARAYQVTLKALIQGNAADKATLRVRKTDVSGSVFLDTFHQNIAVTGSNTLIYGSNICTNTTGADVTATALVGTFQRSSGTGGNVLIAASATHAAYIEIQDIGPASDYPSATAIT